MLIREYRGFKIVDVYWWGKIGIVIINDCYNTKAYIGIGKGENENEDIMQIIDYGDSVYSNQLENILHHIEPTAREQHVNTDIELKPIDIDLLSECKCPWQMFLEEYCKRK